MTAASRNPYRAERLDALAYRSHDPKVDAEQIVDRFRTAGWGGAVVGPQGTGKSTLLRMLAATAEAEGLRVWWSFRNRQGRVGSRSNDPPSGTAVWAIDGWCHLPPWTRWRLRRAAKARGASILGTAHLCGWGLPVRHRSRATPALLEDLSLELDPARPVDAAALLAGCGGNVREALFALYDAAAGRSEAPRIVGRSSSNPSRSAARKPAGQRYAPVMAQDPIQVSELQAPRGTRDFYPEDMAQHRRLLDAWRTVSVRNGFEEVDGPIFETLDLYRVKSGEGIVSELFSFRRSGGSTDYALRAEFTPTLARMVAKRANGLPKPIKWFATPNFCRAERPQRGRLREFWQWNVDFLGEAGPMADAEVIFVLVDLLRELGLREGQVQVRISHRAVVAQMLLRLGVPEHRLDEAFVLLDARAKLDAGVFAERAAGLGLDEPRVQRLDEVCRRRFAAGDLGHLARALGMDAPPDDLVGLDAQLVAFGIERWCAYDLGVVRGLAYYTGTVFEAFETTGVERALAGGGRYDRLIETFGGPPMPAVGFGMGDVVLANMLRDKGLEPDDAGARPDVFVVPRAGADPAAISGWVARLRTAGLHARTTYKATRNAGKLLKEAAAAGARFALLVGEADAAGDPALELKDLQSGEQSALEADAVLDRLR